MAEKEALKFIAAFGGEARELGLGLHAFGGSRYPQAAAQSDHGPNDRNAVFLPRQVADEGLIDLDLVERETAQIAERRIAGAEIIHRDLDPEVAELMQMAKAAVIVLRRGPFR